jgi:hypothetical protein
MGKINLEQFAGGVLSEKFSKAFMQVLQNMQDVNTSQKEKRGISMNITLSQNEGRDDVKVDISVKTKLASVLPGKTQFFVGKDLDTGEIEFEEYGNRSMIKGQMMFSLGEKSSNEIIDGNEVNTVTGEIINEPLKKVTDFRKAMSK